MSKILYPVGTPVTLRKFPKVEGLIVSNYVKGEKYPYRVGFFEGDEVNIEGKSKFSKAGLKRYNPTQAQADEGNAPMQPQSTASCNCYTAEEVDVLLAQQWEQFISMLQSVDSIAVEALRNTHKIAEMTDRNFMKVAKQFKTLNHDDD